MANEQMFKEALDAIHQGQRARARDLLTRLLRTDQGNEEYWLYLSTVVDSEKERRYCLENALKANPKSVAAQRGQVMLGLSPVDDDLMFVRPVRERELDAGEVLSVTGESRKTNQPEIKIPWSSLSGFFMLGALVLVFMMLGVFGNPIYEAPPPEYVVLKPTSTPQPLGYNNNTATAEAMGTAGITATPKPGEGVDTANGFVTATFTGPTPLAYKINPTYTPAALYVVTPHEDSQDFEFGMQNFVAGSWLEAISYLERFIKAEPEHADARYYLGLAYYEIEDYLEAKNAFNGALNLNPEFGAAYLARARTSTAMRQTGLISEDLNLAVRHAVDWPETWLARAEYRITRNNPDGAIADIEKALELDPESARAHYLYALMFMRAEDYERALAEAEIAHELDLTLVDNYYILGKMLVETGQADAAQGHLQTYLTYNPEHGETWLLLAQSQLAQEDYENALLNLEKAEELDDTLYEVVYYQGAIALILEDYERAVEDLEDAARIYPKWFEAQLAYGQAIFLGGNGSQGYTQIHAAFRLAETDEQLAELYYWRALSLEALDLFDDADNDWVRLLSLPSGIVSPDRSNLAQNHINGNYGYTPTPTATEEDAPEATPTP